MEEREEGISGTTIKDTWTKPRGRGIRGGGGRDGWGQGWEVVVGGKCKKKKRKLYLSLSRGLP